MKTILLTGASGFIGHNIQNHGLNPSYRLLCPSRLELNCADSNSVDEYFKHHNVDVVIHAAVKPGHRNAADINNLLYTNARMFFNLEKHHDDYQKMLVIGSGAIYDPRCFGTRVHEDDWKKFIPSDEHGFTKYICAKSIENSSNIYDLRVFGIFGPYEDYAIRFISNAICKSLFDLPITLRQNRIFDYLWIDDLMPVLEWFVENTPAFHAYNITPDHSISLSQLAEKIKIYSGKQLPIQCTHSGMGLEYTGDNQRLKSEMKQLRFTPIDTAIHLLTQWYLDRKPQIELNRLLVDK